MFELSENNRYFFFPEPVRMSYGIDGLSKLVYAHPALSLVSGDIPETYKTSSLGRRRFYPIL